MRNPKIIGLNVTDERSFRYMESFSYFYLHKKANDINYYDCVVANIHAFWYALRGVTFLADATLTDGKTYRVIVITRIRMSAMEGLIMLVDDLEGIENAFTYLDMKCKPSLYDHHEKELIKKYPETYLLLHNYFIEPWRAKMTVEDLKVNHSNK